MFLSHFANVAMLTVGQHAYCTRQKCLFLSFAIVSLLKTFIAMNLLGGPSAKASQLVWWTPTNTISDRRVVTVIWLRNFRCSLRLTISCQSLAEVRMPDVALLEGLLYSTVLTKVVVFLESWCHFSHSSSVSIASAMVFRTGSTCNM